MDVHRRSRRNNIVALAAGLDQHITIRIPSQHCACGCGMVAVHQQVTTARWGHTEATTKDQLEQLLTGLANCLQ